MSTARTSGAEKAAYARGYAAGQRNPSQLSDKIVALSARHGTLLDVRDVCKLLKLGRRSIWRWVSAGIFPRPLRLGTTCVRWRLTDVEAFIDRLVESQNLEAAS